MAPKSTALVSRKGICRNKPFAFPSDREWSCLGRADSLKVGEGSSPGKEPDKCLVAVGVVDIADKEEASGGRSIGL